MALHAFRLSGIRTLGPVLLLATLACTGSPAPVTPELGLEIRWVRDSAEYRALCRQIYAAATAAVEAEAYGRAPGSWAVVLDADETVLSNVGYQVWLAETGQVFDQNNWTAWTRRAEAVPVPGVRAFLERVRELGGHIAVVTNRKQEICGVTEQNLRQERLPYDVVLCRDDERAKDGRWRRVAEGSAREGMPPVEILAWFGDNIYDFPGWNQERRHERSASFEDFGRRFFVLPNPLYGSWDGSP